VIGVQTLTPSLVCVNEFKCYLLFRLFILKNRSRHLCKKLSELLLKKRVNFIKRRKKRRVKYAMSLLLFVVCSEGVWFRDGKVGPLRKGGPKPIHMNHINIATKLD